MALEISAVPPHDARMERWRAVGTAIRHRREALELTREDVRMRGGPSVATQGLVERGAQDGYSGRTLQRLCRVLDLDPAKVDRIVAGELGVEAAESLVIANDDTMARNGDGPSLPRRVEQLDERLTRLESAVDRLLDDEERRAR